MRKCPDLSSGHLHLSVTDAQDLQSNDLVFGENTQIDLAVRSTASLRSPMFRTSTFLSFLTPAKTWMAGTRPAMTSRWF